MKKYYFYVMFDNFYYSHQYATIGHANGWPSDFKTCKEDAEASITAKIEALYKELEYVKSMKAKDVKKW